MSEDFQDVEDQPSPPPAAGGGLLAPVEFAVVALSEDTPAEAVLEVYDRCRFYLAEIKRIQKLCEAFMIEKIKHDGPLEVREGVKYVVTTDKTTKCVDLPGTVEALMGAVDGDFSRFCGVLSANAIKTEAARKVLSIDQYEQFFKVTFKDKLEGGEKADKLIKVDDFWRK